MKRKHNFTLHVEWKKKIPHTRTKNSQRPQHTKQRNEWRDGAELSLETVLKQQGEKGLWKDVPSSHHKNGLTVTKDTKKSREDWVGRIRFW